MLKKLALVSCLVVPSFFVSTLPSHAQNLFGAIARSRDTGDKGYSWNYRSQASAEAVALRQCRSVSGATDCSVMVWFRNACGSIAESSNGGAGSGWGTTPALAEREALKSCRGIGGSCSITRTICTND